MSDYVLSNRSRLSLQMVSNFFLGEKKYIRRRPENRVDKQIDKDWFMKSDGDMDGRERFMNALKIISFSFSLFF